MMATFDINCNLLCLLVKKITKCCFNSSFFVCFLLLRIVSPLSLRTSKPNQDFVISLLFAVVFH